MRGERLLWREAVADDAAMRALGARLGRYLGRWPGGSEPDSPALIVRLEGDLGAGKTTLARGLLRALGQEGPVRSPTYTLVESYEVSVEAGVLKIAHLDLYRLADPEELEFIGWQDLLSEPGLILVEWPDRGGDLLPENGLRVRIEYRGDGREVEIWGSPETDLWGEI